MVVYRCIEREETYRITIRIDSKFGKDYNTTSWYELNSTVCKVQQIDSNWQVVCVEILV